MTISFEDLADLLEETSEKYNQPSFIEKDPISIPHQFSKKEDLEIAAFFAAVLAWGQRKTIIAKCQELLAYMDNSPYDFIRHHETADLKSFSNFKHRTFNEIDTLYFIRALKFIYKDKGGLEGLFSAKIQNKETVKDGLIYFKQEFFQLENSPIRTQKHIASPVKNSACKRLNMFLRWMVRKDNNGVDFGIWKRIQPSQLICPCDVHVERVAKKLGLISLPKVNWKMADDLTQKLRKFDPQDPVKYDFALFGLGVQGIL